MSKKVLILSGSPRNGGNSDILCDEFAKGATENSAKMKNRRAEKTVRRSFIYMGKASKITVKQRK